MNNEMKSVNVMIITMSDQISVKTLSKIHAIFEHKVNYILTIMEVYEYHSVQKFSELLNKLQSADYVYFANSEKIGSVTIRIIRDIIRLCNINVISDTNIERVSHTIASMTDEQVLHELSITSSEPPIKWRTISELNGVAITPIDVSNKGTLRDSKSGKHVATTINHGQPSCFYKVNGVKHRKNVKDLVAKAFLPAPHPTAPSQYFHVIHKDGNALNVNADNLEWGIAHTRLTLNEFRTIVHAMEYHNDASINELYVEILPKLVNTSKFPISILREMRNPSNHKFDMPELYDRRCVFKRIPVPQN